MTDKAQDPQTSALLRLIDPRVPLPYVIGLIVLAAGLYFKVQSLTEAVIDLQITVKAGNQSWAGLASDQALLKFRLGTAEDDIKQLRAALASLHATRK